MRWIFVTAIVWLACCLGRGRADEPSSFAKWSSIEISFAGPHSRGRGEPNPFAIELDVVFTSPSGRRWVVPGFYDGDGRGGEDGNVWKVRFSADELGAWTWATRCTHPKLDKRSGTFVVTCVDDTARGFWKWGRLEAVGTTENGIRYLKFRDGPFWLKAGCDDPENFLGRYRHYDTLAKRKAAVDYLAAKGTNSLYIMTHNIGGDENDVWPWQGATPAEAKQNAVPGHVRFDIAKLTEWRVLFEHMQTQGVVPYLVLEDDSAWTGYDHARYYREIIARFGDLPALLVNIGEENNENYSLQQGLALAARFRQLDPYRHPLGIHNVNRPSDRYIDSPAMDFTSIQTGSPGRRKGLEKALEHNRITVDWIERCRVRRRRVLVVNFDEARPEEDRRCWWSVYMGGGVWETHVRQPYDRPLSAWEPTWTQLGGARSFMESLPFWEMSPHNELVESGRAFCLARPGKAYALYLPMGGRVTVRRASGVTYEAAGWNPVNGKEGRFEHRTTINGGLQHFTAPSPGDWALRILAKKEP